MPISVLPAATIHLLGSPLVITTPASIVKELVENSIDAEANSIDVLISPNTVDSIEIRDNGRGIRPGDFDCLGRRAHTSKLCDFEEVGRIGGKSLGFRGEALASANGLAKITIVTRTSGEPVAAKLHLADGGGVAQRDRVSAPVGTAVRLTGLFAQLPVRKRVSIKEASKTIARIKELLQSYALARLKIRYSLKVLGKPRLSWSYSPVARSEVREAVLTMFGPDLASQCHEVTAPTHPGPLISGTDHNNPSSGTPLPAVPVIEAFLPIASADTTKLSKGAFIYVDSRPISTSKGTARKLLSLFKGCISKISMSNGPGCPAKDTFIRVNISCQPDSYDLNVEPSKDDVLFADEKSLLDAFEAILHIAYPGLQQSPFSTGDRVSPEQFSPAPNLGSTRLAQLAQQGLSLSEMGHKETDHPGPASEVHGVRPLLPPSPFDDQSGDVFRPQGGPSGIAAGASRVLECGEPDNPHRTVCATGFPGASPPGLGAASPRGGDGPRPSRFVLEQPMQEGQARPGDLPTFPIGLTGDPENGMEIGPLALRPPDGMPGTLQMPMRNEIRYRKIDAAAIRNPYRSPVSTPPRLMQPFDDAAVSQGNQWRGTNYTSLFTPPSSHGPRARRQRGSRAMGAGIYGYRFRTTFPPRVADCVRPTNQQADGEPLGVDGVIGGGIRFNRRATGRGFFVNQDGRRPVPERRDMTRFLAIGMNTSDYRNQRTVDPNTVNSGGRFGTPHPGSGALTEKAPLKTDLPTGDSRAYLMRRQHSLPASTPRKLRRVKSELLPLETCDEDSLKLVQTLNIDIQKLFRELDTAVLYDAFVRNGTLEKGLDMAMGSADVVDIETRLRGLVRRWADASGNGAEAIEVNILSSLKGKSAQK